MLSVTWVGGDGSTPTAWGDANNWSSLSVPGASDDVIINPTSNPPSITTGAQGIKSLTDSDGLTVSGGSLSVTNGETLSGSISITSGFVTFAGAFTNTGTVSVSGGTVNLTGSWNNSGTYNLTGGTLNFGGSFATSDIGTVAGTGGTAVISGNVNNAGSTLNLDTGHHTFQLSGGTITGGTVTPSGGTGLDVINGTFDGVTLSGDLTLGHTNSYLGVTNGFVLNATVTLSNRNANLSLLSSEALSGTGTVAVVGQNSEISMVPSTTVTFASGITVRGGSSSGFDGYVAQVTTAGAAHSVINYGTISGDVPNARITVGDNDITFINHGIIQAVGGGAVTIRNGTSGSFTNSSDGTVAVNGVSSSSTSTLTVIDTWHNSGTFDLGTSSITTGTLVLGGNFVTSDLGTLSRNGGTLSVAGTLTNTGSTLTLDTTTGSWVLAGTIVGGTIDLNNSTSLIGSGGRLDGDGSGMTINGDLNLTSSGASLKIKNGVTLNGTATLSGNNASFEFENSQTFGGSATVAMTGSSATLYIDAGAAVTFASAVTVNGGNSSNGRIGLTNGTNSGHSLVNQGTISASVSGGTLAVGDNNFTFTNSGVIQAATGGRLNVFQGVSFSGVSFTNSSGATVSVTGTNSQVFVGYHQGTYSNSWHNSGTYAISAGTMTLDGTIATNDLGSMSHSGGILKLAGTVTNTASTLEVNSGYGTFTLSGGTIKGGNVVVDGSGAVNVTGTALFDGVTLGGSISSTTYSGNVTITDQSTLTINSGLALINDSTVTLSSTTASQVTKLAFQGSGTQSLTGPGTIVLDGTASSSKLSVDRSTGSGTSLSVASSITIQGKGTIDAGTSGDGLINNGTIQANATGTILTIGPAVALTNSTSGLIKAQNGATLSASGSFLNNGTVTATGANSVFSAVGTAPTNDGLIQATSGGILTLGLGSSAFVNNGTVHVYATGGVILNGTVVDLEVVSLGGPVLGIVSSGLPSGAGITQTLSRSWSGGTYTPDAAGTLNSVYIDTDLEGGVSYSYRAQCDGTGSTHFIVDSTFVATSDALIGLPYQISPILDPTTNVELDNYSTLSGTHIWTADYNGFVTGSPLAALLEEFCTPGNQLLTNGAADLATATPGTDGKYHLYRLRVVDTPDNIPDTWSLQPIPRNKAAVTDIVYTIGFGTYNYLSSVLDNENPNGLGGNPGANGTSDDPIRYSDGTVFYQTNDLTSNGLGGEFSQSRNWTNAPGLSTQSVNGTGMINPQLPRLVSVDAVDELGVVNGGTDVRLFNSNDNGSSYSADSFIGDTLQHNVSDSTLLYTDTLGTQTTFFDFSSSTPVDRQGAFKSMVDPAGNVTVATYNGDDQITEIDRKDSSGTVREAWLYTYIASGLENAGMLSNVQLRRSTSTGSIVRQVAYTYYTGTVAAGTATTGGSSGDLKTVSIEDASGNVIDEEYYRYYNYNEANGYTHGLKYIFDSESFARLSAGLGASNVFTASDSDVAGYATQYFQYDSDRRVILHAVQGAGSSTASIDPGVGTFTYSYSASNNADGTNSWKYKTIETLPDGNENIVYSNYLGEVMLKIFVDTTDPANAAMDGTKWGTFYAYDSSGRLVLQADPSAVDMSQLTNTYEGYVDLLHNQNGNYQYLFDSTGQVQFSTYYISTTAASNSYGGVAGYLQSQSIQNGEFGPSSFTLSISSLGQSSGTATATTTSANGYQVGDIVRISGAIASAYNGAFVITAINSSAHQFSFKIDSATPASTSGTIVVNKLIAQKAQQYTSRTANSITVYPLGTSTVYRNDDGTVAETTSYSNSYTGSSLRPQSTIVTYPTVDDSENGSGTPDQEKTVYDVYGRPIWFKDGGGYLTYTQYDLATGAITESVVDVDPSSISSPPVSDPGRGWGGATLPTALNLKTTMDVDGLGRTTKITDPLANASSGVSGDITYTVYNDAATFGSGTTGHEVRVYPGWHQVGSTWTTTGPVQITREVRGSTNTFSGVYMEALTSTAMPTLLSGTTSPDGKETFNTSDIQSLSRSLYDDADQLIEVDAYYSLAGTTYSPTTLRLGSASNDTSSTGGTFHKTVYAYDSQGLPSHTQDATGTINDIGYDGLGRIATTSVGTNDGTSGNNMVIVTTNVYDDNNSGDGNLTQTMQIPGGGAADRVIHYFYDWRDRLVETKQGETGKEQVTLTVGGTIDATDKFIVTVSDFAGASVQLSITAGSMVPSTVASTIESEINSSTDSYIGLVTASAVGDTVTLTAKNLFSVFHVSASTTEGSGTQSNGQTFTVADTDPVLSEDDGTNRLISYNQFNNLNEITENDQYVGDGVLVSISNGVPQAPSSGLVAEATTDYDERGRLFARHVFSVSSGAPSSSTLDMRFWYDQRGNVIKESDPGGLVTKTNYDGADRPTVVYQTDGGSDGGTGASTTWTDAGNVNGDIVLSQREIQYDVDGNAIFTIDRERFDNDLSPSSSSQDGTLTNPVGDSYHAARASYVENYYDQVNRLIGAADLGTNGGTSLTSRPDSSLPAASDTKLTTSYQYGTNELQRLVLFADSGTFTLSFGGHTTPSPIAWDASASTIQSALEGLSSIGTGNVSVTSVGYLQYIIEFLGTLARHDVAQITGSSSLTLSGSAGVLGLSTIIKGSDGGWLSKTTDPRGIVTLNDHDLLGRTSQTIANATPMALLVSSMLMAPSQITSYTYDGMNHVLTMTADGQETAYKYAASQSTGSNVNSNDLLTATDYPDLSSGIASSAQEEKYTYNALGDKQSYSDRNGSVHSYSYDVLGRQTADTITTLGTGVDGTVRQQTYSFDSTGNLQFATSLGDGNTASSASFTGGELKLMFSSHSYHSGDYILISGATQTQYDGIFPITVPTGSTTEVDVAISGSPGSPTGTIVVRKVVNQDERLYNGLSQLTSEYQSASGAVDTGTTPVVQYVYNEMAGSTNNSRQIELIYPNGRIVHYVYNSGIDDSISRLSSITDDDGSGDPGAPLEEFTYLGLSTIVKEAHPETGTDLTYIKQSGESNGDAGDRYTGLDRFGRVVDQRWINSSGAVDRFQYGYDRDGNVLYKNNLVNSGSSELYHANSTDYASYTNNQAYDPLNRLFMFERGTLDTGLDRIASPSQTETFHLSTEGDWFDQPSGYPASRRYFNQQNQLTDIVAVSGTNYQMSYDANGNLVSDEAVHLLVPYDDVSVAGDVSLQGSYGPDDIPATIMSQASDNAYVDIPSGSDGVLVKLTSDDLTSIGSDDSVKIFIRAATEGVVGYQFDLEDADGNVLASGGNEIHDSDYNVDEYDFTISGGVSAATMSAGLRLRVWANDEDRDDLELSGAWMTVDTLHSPASYTYDAWNRQVGFITTSASGTYTYDVLGRQLAESATVSSTTTTRDLLYSSKGQVLEEQIDGIVSAQNVWSISYVNDLIECDQMDSGGGFVQRLYALHDANHNVTSIVESSSGSIVERYLYDPYGSVTVLSPSWSPVSGNTSSYDFRYLYQGGRRDLTTGIYTFSHRQYDPSLGMWLQQDPAGYIDGANLYQFENSNPVNRTDPTGLCANDLLWLGQKASALLQIAGGLLETALGLSTLETGVGGLLALHGIDTAVAGFENLFGDGTNRTQTAQGIANVAGWLGADKTTAGWIGTAGDAFLGIGSAIGTTSALASEAQMVAGAAEEVAASGVSGYNEAATVAASEGQAGVAAGAEAQVAAANSSANRAIADQIAGGHAFEKHVLEQGEFPGWIRTQDQFAEHIENVLNNPTAVGAAPGNATAYWHGPSGTIVIVNPAAPDLGTAFQPTGGFLYFLQKIAGSLEGNI